MPDVVTALCLDRSGLLWIGTFGGGLSALDPASGAITTWWSRPSDPATNSDDRVDSLFEDQSGILWVGTHADAVLEMTGTVTGTP